MDKQLNTSLEYIALRYVDDVTMQSIHYLNMYKKLKCGLSFRKHNCEQCKDINYNTITPQIVTTIRCKKMLDDIILHIQKIHNHCFTVFSNSLLDKSNKICVIREIMNSMACRMRILYSFIEQSKLRDLTNPSYVELSFNMCDNIISFLDYISPYLTDSLIRKEVTAMVISTINISRDNCIASICNINEVLKKIRLVFPHNFTDLTYFIDHISLINCVYNNIQCRDVKNKLPNEIIKYIGKFIKENSQICGNNARWTKAISLLRQYDVVKYSINHYKGYTDAVHKQECLDFIKHINSRTYCAIQHILSYINNTELMTKDPESFKKNLLSILLQMFSKDMGEFIQCYVSIPLDRRNLTGKNVESILDAILTIPDVIIRKSVLEKVINHFNIPIFQYWHEHNTQELCKEDATKTPLFFETIIQKDDVILFKVLVRYWKNKLPTNFIHCQVGSKKRHFIRYLIEENVSNPSKNKILTFLFETPILLQNYETDRQMNILHLLCSHPFVQKYIDIVLEYDNVRQLSKAKNFKGLSPIEFSKATGVPDFGEYVTAKLTMMDTSLRLFKRQKK